MSRPRRDAKKSFEKFGCCTQAMREWKFCSILEMQGVFLSPTYVGGQVLLFFYLLKLIFLLEKQGYNPQPHVLDFELNNIEKIN